MSGGSLRLPLRFRSGLNADSKPRSNKGHTENHLAVIYFIHPCENWCNSHLSTGITGKFQEILNSGRVILMERKSFKFQSNPFSAAWIHTISGRKVELSSDAFRTIPLAAVNEMKFNWISEKKYLLKALKGSNYRISSYLCFSLGENCDSCSPLTVKMTAVLHAQTSPRHFLPLLMKGGTADVAWERCLKKIS